MPQWTDQQTEAIYTKGNNTLVAAAAGSGKTAVLVERIIQKVLNQEDPVDIDALLVATFTNAAAQEMRNRVAAALERALEENPDSLHLKKQLTLLQQASISTLHSFCMDLIRRHAYLLDIDPGFRIADDIEADLLRQEVMEDLFETWYGKDTEDQERFFSVVDRFSNDRSDQDVETLVLKLYDFAMQNPWPEAWLDQVAERYQIAPETDEASISWLSILKDDVRSQLEAIENELSQALQLTKESDGPYHYAEALDSDFEMLQEAKAQLAFGWDSLRNVLITGKFKALSRKKIDCDENKKEKVKAIRNKVKKRWNSLAEQWFARELSSYLSDIHALYPTIKQLVLIVKEFKQKYSQLKKEKALVDFADLEHYVLAILLADDATADNIKPSPVAEALKEKYAEVLMDEYQDTNLVQETILSLVTKDQPGNLFMVGDVKQSIYRFRHAEPSLFIEKYKKFHKDPILGHRIDLARNFRSRKEVLQATNFIFRQLLDESVGELVYDEAAELVYGNVTYDQVKKLDAEAELVIIDRSDQAEETDEEPDNEETQADLAKAQIEARAYAKRIKYWIGNDQAEATQIMDKETGMNRPVQYRDIVILLRSMTWAPTIMEELKQQGIPVYAELSTGYLEAIEIKVMISLLKVIDNPKQDIPLASVLRSPIVGLDEEDLAQIRLTNKRTSYYQALQTFEIETTDKKKQARVSKFLRQLQNWRKKARQGGLAELIWQIYRETGYYDFVGGIPGGRQRQANLRALYDRARGYEETSFRGLFRFLRMIERMEERGEDLGAARALGEQEDVVRIMTIHKSKGLEFPIVILGALDKQFNQQDLRQRYLLHKDLGFGSKYVDPNNRIMYPTLFYHALKQQMQREMWAEEMRVLYVALTRAKEKLVMIGTVSSFEKKQAKWQEILDHQDWVLPAQYRLDMNTYLDWIGASVIRHSSGVSLRTEELSTILTDIHDDPSKWSIKLEHAQMYQNVEQTDEDMKIDIGEKIRDWQVIQETDGHFDRLVNERLTFTYAHQQAANARAKQTVTELKRQLAEKDAYSDDRLVQTFHAPIVKRPNFMQKEKRLSAAEIGTAMHTVMQHLPLTKAWKTPALQEYVQSLVTREILTQEQADHIHNDSIEQFFQTDVGRYLLEVEDVEREVPFSLTVPANTVYPDWETSEQEKVFIQGVIDLLVPYEDGWILIDYKTDRVPAAANQEQINKLRERYQVQLNLYAKAIEEIWRQPVKGKYLYFFDHSLLINVK